MRDEADEVLVLDTGDALVGGGELGDYTEGKVIVEGFNLLGVDAMAIGTKEVELGPETLGARMAEAEFAMLSANLRSTATGERFTEGYAFFDRGGHRVGVIGLTRAMLTPPDGFDVRDPMEGLNEVLPEVLAQTSTVILLTNVDFDRAQEIVRHAPDVDLVIAANPERVPDHVLDVPGTGTLAIVAEKPSARHTGRRVGRFDVTVGVDGTLTDAAWSKRALDDKLADDAAMNRLLERYEIQ